ncbi:hypothetical protein ACH4CC_07170 [Streptomyces lydicus]|uniref:hypothetical protein n=1 Tax=Streptomyces lydicus TaxID=47763 RepID=UPI003795F4AF
MTRTARPPPGRGGTPLSPYDDRPFGELAERFRHDAAPCPRLHTPWATRPARPRPRHRGLGRLVPAAAAVSLAAGLVLAHGLLLAGGLVLAGLAAHLAGAGHDRRP